LILLGIDLLLGRRNPWLGAIIAAAMVLAVVAVAIWMTLTGVSGGFDAGPGEQKSVSVPLNGAASGDVTLQFPAGGLAVGSLASDSPNLAQATASGPSATRLFQQSSAQPGRGDVVVLGVNGSSNTFPFFRSNRGGGGLTMDALLNPRVPLTLRADVGAGQSTFDLTGLQVKQFTLNNGAGQATIRLPSGAGQNVTDVHSGAGQVILVVPPGAGAHIHSEGGLVNLHVPTDRFQSVADGYQTSDFATAQNRVDVTLHVGFGQVDVQ